MAKCYCSYVKCTKNIKRKISRKNVEGKWNCNSFLAISVAVNVFLHCWSDARDKCPFNRNHAFLMHKVTLYHRLHWYATSEIKTLAKPFPRFPSMLHVIDRLDLNPPITATSVTFWTSLNPPITATSATFWTYIRHASGLWLVDFNPIRR